MKHVIIGTGAAGMTAARKIRELRPLDHIIMISADERINSRCMLHKYIGGEREVEDISFVEEGFFDKNGIEWRSRVEVTGVDMGDRAVLCGKERISFDKLLIATGSSSIIPNIGSLREANNVYGLRNLTDAMGIKAAARLAGKAVIIGGGLTSMDAAYALLESKKDVTVVEMLPSIMSLYLDERAASAYRELFEKAGCNILTGRGITGTVEDDNGNIVQVTFEDDTAIDCDLVVVAVGARPAIGFLEGSGIAYDNAVKVDKYLMTNRPGVYAAGDAAGISAIWPNAMRQGEIAGRNMCGKCVKYEDAFTAKNTVNFFGLTTLSVGATEPEEGDTVYLREDRNKYQKMIMRDGCVIGAIMQGDISGCGFWQHLIKNGIRVDKIKKPIWKISYADFYDTQKNGEYLWAT